jgi:hypothetical protein
MTLYEFFALYAPPVFLGVGGWIYALLARRTLREKYRQHS